MTVFFRLRQLRRPELGRKILDHVCEMLAEVADIENRSGLEGRQMVMVLAPKGQIGRALKGDEAPPSRGSRPVVEIEEVEVTDDDSDET